MASDPSPPPYRRPLLQIFATESGNTVVKKPKGGQRVIADEQKRFDKILELGQKGKVKMQMGSLSGQESKRAELVARYNQHNAWFGAIYAEKTDKSIVV